MGKFKTWFLNELGNTPIGSTDQVMPSTQDRAATDVANNALLNPKIGKAVTSLAPAQIPQIGADAIKVNNKKSLTMGPRAPSAPQVGSKIFATVNGGKTPTASQMNATRV